jgi:RimK family alpha-L-glutamate ligase
VVNALAQTRSNRLSARMRIAIVSTTPSATTQALTAVRIPGVELFAATPVEAACSLSPGDAALGRLDVRRTLDGVEEGLWALGVLEARGVTVMNGAGTLLATHDKLLTARILRRAGLPHPLTRHLRGNRVAGVLTPPLVLKPRHGSWGRHVVACETDDALAEALERARGESWYVQHGAIAQELIPPTGSDLRVVVANGRVVGAVRREAAPGEWRTNVALGARRVPVDPPLAAVQLALAATSATTAVLAGVDLLPTPDGGYTILEVNGAVEFTPEYRLHGDVFREAALEIARAAGDTVAGESPEGADSLLV